MKPLEQLRVAFASDHAGYTLKQNLISRLREKGVEVSDLGCPSADSCDYPDYAHPLALAVENGTVDFGVVICSTGNGICMTANKHQGVRAALCWQVPVAELARRHNNANVLGLPASFVTEQQAWEMLETFLRTDFEGGRHARRVSKIACA